MLVPYLRENAELAQVVCREIATRDGWMYRLPLVREAVSCARLPLRFEIIHWKNKQLILDAAHNPQKMQGLADAMKEAFPDQLYAVACAFNPGTDVAGTAMPLLPSASKVACIDFVAGEEAYQFRFLNPVEAAECIVKKGSTKIAPAILNEWPEVVAWIEALPEKLVVLTGSFHFVADARAKLLKQEG
jgi:folylpolyglutamate synthase/dihydropteroate synthase